MATIERPLSFFAETYHYFGNFFKLERRVSEGLNLDDLIIRTYKNERDCIGMPFGLPGYESKQCRGASGVLAEIDKRLEETFCDRAMVLVPQNNSEEPYWMMQITRRRKNS